jgi:RNA polymerase sigma-70 factor (ECF subfamily)
MNAGLKGDSNAYRKLLHETSCHLRGYYKGKLARIGRSAAEAEDLVQDALMAIHTRRHTYNPAQPLTPWIYAIARYKLIDHLRRTRHSISDLPMERADAITARDDHVGSETALDLSRLLSRLPDKMRRAIQCVKLEGLSTAEAARQCGMSESAIKVSVHRGLKAMAGMVAQRKNHED